MSAINAQPAPSPDAPAARTHWPALDALRAVGALLVFINHLAVHGVIVLPSVLALLQGGTGNAGVVLFFMLSGFLLFGPFLAEADGGQHVSRRAFLIRRVARIYPAYLVALLGVTLISGSSLPAQQPLTYLTMAQNYSPELIGGFWGVSWTLTVEAAFYISLPLLVGLLGIVARGRPRPTALVILAITIGSMIAQVVIPSLATRGLPADQAERVGSVLWVSFPLCAWSFGLGMLIALLVRYRSDLARRFQPTRVRAYTIVLATAGIAIAWNEQLTWLAGLGLAGLLLVFIESDWKWRPVAWLIPFGAFLSYPFYLWHSEIMKRLVLELPGQPLLVAPLALGLSIAVAAASYYLVERHAMRLGRRLADRLR